MGKYNKTRFDKGNEILRNKRNGGNDSVVVMWIVCTVLEMWLCNALRDEMRWWVSFEQVPSTNSNSLADVIDDVVLFCYPFRALPFMCANICAFSLVSKPALLSFNSTNLHIHMKKSFNCFYNVLPFCFLLSCSLLSSGRKIHFIFVSSDSKCFGFCDSTSNADCNEIDVKFVQGDIT